MRCSLILAGGPQTIFGPKVHSLDVAEGCGFPSHSGYFITKIWRFVFTSARRLNKLCFKRSFSHSLWTKSTSSPLPTNISYDWDCHLPKRPILEFWKGLLVTFETVKHSVYKITRFGVNWLRFWSRSKVKCDPSVSLISYWTFLLFCRTSVWIHGWCLLVSCARSGFRNYQAGW